MSETCRGHLWDKIIIKLFSSSWYIFLTYFFKTHFNIILICAHSSYKLVLSITFPQPKLCLYFSSPPHVPHASPILFLMIWYPKYKVLTGTYHEASQAAFLTRLLPRPPYTGADKSLARPTSRFISFDCENISFDASFVTYINSTNISPIMIMNGQNHVPWGRLNFWKWVPGISPRVKAAVAYGWRPTTLVVPKLQENPGL